MYFSHFHYFSGILVVAKFLVNFDNFRCFGSNLVILLVLIRYFDYHGCFQRYFG